MATTNIIPVKQGKKGTYLDLYPESSYDPTAFERPTYAVDMAIFRLFEGQLEILLIKRGQDPFKGRWAFPGGFVDIRNRECSEQAAVRELKEETGVADLKGTPTQFHTFSDANRDPRWYNISTVYYYLMREEEWTRVPAPKEGDDAAEVRWWPVSKITKGKMGFDHYTILTLLHMHLMANAWELSLPFKLVPKRSVFTLPELHEAYEALTSAKVDAGNFYKAVKKRYMLRRCGGKKAAGGVGRPADYYTSDGVRDAFA